jgi:hypothetical protein
MIYTGIVNTPEAFQKQIRNIGQIKLEKSEKKPPKLEESDPGKSVKIDPRRLVESAPRKSGEIDPVSKE